MYGATEVLKDLGILDDTWYPDWATERGAAVHLHTAAADAGARRPTLIPEWRGFARSWQHWREIYAVEDVLVEEPMLCYGRRLAGTPDRVCIIRRPGYPPHVGIPDMKTGALEPWHVLQASLYELLVDEWLKGRAMTATHRSPALAIASLPRISYGVYLDIEGGPPRVRTFPFQPIVHSLLATVQFRRSLLRQRG